MLAQTISSSDDAGWHQDFGPYMVKYDLDWTLAPTDLMLDSRSRSIPSSAGGHCSPGYGPITDANETLMHAHVSVIALLMWQSLCSLLSFLFTTGALAFPCLSVSFGICAVACALFPWPPGRSDCSRRAVVPRHGRFRHGSLLLLLLCSSMDCGFASEDENVWAAIRQRARAGVQQANNAAIQRWRWVFDHYGLPQPAIGGYYDCEVHRAEQVPLHSPSSLGLRVASDRDAVDTLQRVAAGWNDVQDILPGNVAWQLHEAHAACRQSLVLNEGARHFVLTTYAEDQARPMYAAVLLEIAWIWPPRLRYHFSMDAYDHDYSADTEPCRHSGIMHDITSL